MGGKDTDVFDLFSETYTHAAREEVSLQQYLLACREDKSMYASAPERMVDAIGQPKLLDTSADERLGRIFANRTIKIYPSFAEFYGMEDTIERIVGYFRYASQGLEERKQILYLLGPVGGGKSSLAERLKKLMEMRPIYTLKVGNEISPVFESPLGLFNPDRMADLLEDKYGIARRRLNGLISPWASKRLDQLNGDISKFSVVKLMPSRLRQIAIAKTEPGDENNQDVSALVGKVDIRQLENFSQSDPDAYSYSGGLNRTTQGLLEFVEMFKAPIKVLHPLLTATQEGSYNGTENFGSFPFQGIVLAHSNEFGMAPVQEQQEQRGLPRPHPCGEGSLLPARHGGKAHLREASARKRTGQQPLRAGSSGYFEPLHGVDPACRSRKLAALHQDAGL